MEGTSSFYSINEIDNRLALQIQERNKLELQRSETMKLYGRTKQLIDKTKTGENYLFFIYIDRSNNRLVFNIKDGYKVELQIPETMKLYGSTKRKRTESLSG